MLLPSNVRSQLKLRYPQWNTLHGVDVLTDVKRLLPSFSAEIIFDVGANVGQSAEVFQYHFPQATIWCFEPFPDTFKTLKENCSKWQKVVCEKVALGATAKQVYVCEGRSSAENTVTVTPEGDATQQVAMTTVDEFCRRHDIETINFLKVDTEGHDLEVLKGASSMLQQQKIDFVELEAGMNPENDYHVPFAELTLFLESLGYRLFGIYDQMHEWKEPKPVLRRSNPVFISPKLINTYAI